MNALGTMIRDARERAGMSLADVMAQSGMSRAYLCQLECGYPKATLSHGAALKVARTLGLNGDDLAARCYLKRVPPDLWPAIRKVLNDHIKKGKPVA